LAATVGIVKTSPTAKSVAPSLIVNVISLLDGTMLFDAYDEPTVAFPRAPVMLPDTANIPPFATAWIQVAVHVSVTVKLSFVPYPRPPNYELV
jgi:hypothetical protein